MGDKTKLYFTSLNDVLCKPKREIMAIMAEQNITQVDAYEAKKDKATDNFYCRAFNKVGEQGDCGKKCEKYAPTNGHTGKCTSWSPMYTRSRIKTIITAAMLLFAISFTSCKKGAEHEVSVYYNITNSLVNGSVEINNNGEKLTMVSTNNSFRLVKKLTLRDGEKYYFSIKGDGGKCGISVISENKSIGISREMSVELKGRF